MSFDMHICMYLYLCVCMCMYPQDVHINFKECICAKCMYLYVSCMYIVCICFFACIWYVSCMCKYVYVWHILAQTNTLEGITWRNDLLQGPHHAGPTQGIDEQVPICFVPPSRPTCQTRFGALPRAARVEGGPTRVQGVTNRPPMCINTLLIPS